MTVVQLSDKKSEPEIGSRAELEKLSAPSLALQLRDGPSATLSWLISQTSLNFAPGLFDKWPRGCCDVFFDDRAISFMTGMVAAISAFVMG